MLSKVEVLERETWQVTETNAEQQYLTHGAFRYFGKLPPTLTGRLLDVASVAPGSTIVDVMCGSGTTLVEAGLRGARSVGVDCNDLSVLISRVKTTPIADATYNQLQQAFDKEFAGGLSTQWPPRDDGQPPPFKPDIRNLERWFIPATIRHLGMIRQWCMRHEGPIRDLLLVAFAGIIREASQASVRTGRLFFDKDKRAPNPYTLFVNRLAKLRQGNGRFGPNYVTPSQLVVADARNTGLPSALADVVFCHPPYFSLYKYSSDILRFELAWLGLNRKQIAALEIEDGFKTTDASLARSYVADLVAVAREAQRLAKPGGWFLVITADSTLRLQPLGIMADLISRIRGETRWVLRRHAIRPVRFTQATYHKSANAEIKRADDEILMFQLPS